VLRYTVEGSKTGKENGRERELVGRRAKRKKGSRKKDWCQERKREQQEEKKGLA
jgi:hypothetical protein